MGVAEHPGKLPALGRELPELDEMRLADQLLGAVALALVEDMIAFLDRAEAGDGIDAQRIAQQLAAAAPGIGRFLPAQSFA